MQTHFIPPLAVVLAGLLTSISSSSPAQEQLEPRAPGLKFTLAQMQAQPASSRVIVKFREGNRIRMGAAGLTGMAGPDAASFGAALASLGVSPDRIRRQHARSEEALDRERIAAEQESGRDLADLNLYYVIDLPPGVDAAALADRLNRLAIVEYAAPAPQPAPPPVDIPPTTPNLTENQGYKNLPPQGIGALNPVSVPGGDGAGIRFVDIEYSWQLNHEDLSISVVRELTGGATPQDPFADADHGTAVLGEIVGRKNNYGVTGIAPAAIPYVAPANTVQFGYDPARAIGLATALLRRGEVILIEQQTVVCNLGGFNYGPSEWHQDVFDAISLATAKGITVVEAAGNGNINLDQAACLDRFNRNVRNSLALIVGAGHPSAHFRLSFSSYGTRLDVQGWGSSVTTLGYGDAFNPGDVRQRYTFGFNGTSSASPIVAGAVLAMQGVVRECGRALLRPPEIRNALKTTGTPQPGAAGNRIGPLPRIRQALEATTAHSCI